MVHVGLQTATRAPVQPHAVLDGVGVAEAPTTVRQDVNLTLELVMMEAVQLHLQLHLHLLEVVVPSGTSRDQKSVLCHTAA